MKVGESIGYVMPEWPGQTHLWLWREICHMREFGASVRLFSTRRPPERDKARHAFAAQAEAETTYLWPAGLWRTLVAIVSCFLRNPAGLFRCIKLAWTLPLDKPRRLSQLKLIVPACVLARETRRGQIGHLHSHAPANSSILCMMVKRLTGVPFSQTVNANIEWWGGAMREKFHDAAFTLACTQWMFDQMRRDYPELDASRVGLCRMAVDVRKWVAVERTPAANGALRVLTVSRLVDSKGHDDLIKAVALVANRGHPIHLRIGGAGPEQQALESLLARLGAGSVVTFLGSLSEEKYLDEMRAADVFALASHCEPLGVVYMEALATAAAVIGTAAGGVGELIVNGVNGLLVPPQNPEALAVAIETLLKDPELRRLLGKAGRQKVEMEFDSRQWAAELYRWCYGELPKGSMGVSPMSSIANGEMQKAMGGTPMLP